MSIEMIIDPLFRIKMTKLHTAGHLIDLAVTQLSIY
jgi:Ser-tRNA(Ala) deacylase AlaX